MSWRGRHAVAAGEEAALVAARDGGGRRYSRPRNHLFIRMVVMMMMTMMTTTIIAAAKRSVRSSPRGTAAGGFRAPPCGFRRESGEAVRRQRMGDGLRRDHRKRNIHSSHTLVALTTTMCASSAHMGDALRVDGLCRCTCMRDAEVRCSWSYWWWWWWWWWWW